MDDELEAEIVARTKTAGPHRRFVLRNPRRHERGRPNDVEGWPPQFGRPSDRTC